MQDILKVVKVANLDRTPAVSEIELAFIRLGASVLACDLDENRRIRNLSTLGSRRLLVMTSDRRGEDVKTVFLSVVQRVFEKNNPIMRLEAFSLRGVFQDCLDELRRDDPALVGAVSSCRGFFLNNRRLYSLNETEAEIVYIYRRGSLLEFKIGPQHFIPLQAQDVLLLSKGDMVSLLKTTGQLKRFGSPGPIGFAMRTIREELEPRLLACKEPSSLVAIRVDASLPVPAENTRDQRVRVLGQVSLFLLYAALTSVSLLVIFWLI